MKRPNGDSISSYQTNNDNRNVDYNRDSFVLNQELVDSKAFSSKNSQNKNEVKRGRYGDSGILLNNPIDFQLSTRSVSQNKKLQSNGLKLESQPSLAVARPSESVVSFAQCEVLSQARPFGSVCDIQPGVSEGEPKSRNFSLASFGQLGSQGIWNVQPTASNDNQFP